MPTILCVLFCKFGWRAKEIRRSTQEITFHCIPQTLIWLRLTDICLFLTNQVTHIFYFAKDCYHMTGFVIFCYPEKEIHVFLEDLFVCAMSVIHQK